MMAKRLSVIILIVILIFPCAFAAKSSYIDIDGYVNEKAWHSAKTQVLLPSTGVSNSDVDFATAQVLFDEDNHLVYLGFKVRLTTDTEDLAERGYGIRLSINGGDFIEFTALSADEYDIDAYNYTVGFSSDGGVRFNAEVLLGVKYGLETLESIRVRFIDGFGIPSNAYEVDLPQLLNEQTTTALAVDDTTNSITTTAKTTTTKPTATERKTTACSTAKKQTTAKAVTAAKPDKTKPTATKKATKTTVKAVTVYITIPVSEISSVQNETEMSTSAAQETSESNEEKISKPQKISAYFGVAALLVATFGVIVVVNMNAEKKAQEQEKNKK